MTNNIYGNLMNDQSGSASFTMVKQFQNDQSFSSYFLFSVYCFPLSFPFCFDVQTIQEQQLSIEENHLIFRTNIQNDTQQWYQWTCHFERRVCGLILSLTLYVWNWWQIRCTETDKLPNYFFLLHYGKIITGIILFFSYLQLIIFMKK